MIGFEHYLLVASLLFCIGLFGIIYKRNAVALLMSVELILNAANINLVAINKYIIAGSGLGQLFALFVIVVAAAEVAVGLALIINIYRLKKSSQMDDFNILKW